MTCPWLEMNERKKLFQKYILLMDNSDVILVDTCPLNS